MGTKYDGKPHPERAQSLDDRGWLSWFLRCYDNAPLVMTGLWKRHTWVIEDMQRREAIPVIRSAFALDGPNGAWAVIVSEAIAEAPEGFEPPPLPADITALRRRYEESINTVDKRVKMFRRDR